MAIKWTVLQLFDKDNDPVETTSERGISALQEFRETGSINGVFFQAIGADHEDPDDASTWGPQTPADVDWTGFPA